MRLFSLLAALLITLTPVLASAERVELLPSAPSAETRSEYYGGYIIAADAVAVALTFGAESVNQNYIYLPVSTYLLGGPITHIAHGRPGAAVGSLAMRLTLPVMGAFAGAGMESCSDDEFMCGFGGFVVGGALGIGTAMILDWTLLGRRTVEVAPRPRKGVFTAMPDVSVSRDGDVRLGLMGTF